MRNMTLIVWVLFFIFLFVSVINSQTGNKNLYETKWVFILSDSVFDYIILKRSNKFEKFSTENDQTYFGRFYLLNDTIVMKIDSAKYMEDFSKGQLKYLIKSDSLRIIYAKWGHQKPITKFDPKYVFHRDKSYRPESDAKMKPKATKKP